MVCLRICFVSHDHWRLMHCPVIDWGFLGFGMHESLCFVAFSFPFLPFSFSQEVLRPKSLLSLRFLPPRSPELLL
jgi:hypothetical protein